MLSPGFLLDPDIQNRVCAQPVLSRHWPRKFDNMEFRSTTEIQGGGGVGNKTLKLELDSAHHKYSSFASRSPPPSQGHT